MTKKLPLRQLKLLWQFMQGNRVLYLGAILSIGCATAFGLIGPLVLRTTIDSIIGDKPLILRQAPLVLSPVLSGVEGEAEGSGQAPIFDWLHTMIQAVGGKSVLAQNLWICSLILLTLALAEAIFLYFKGKWSAMAAESTTQHIRDQLYDHLQHLSYDYHINAETGDLIQRCTSDVDTIRQFLSVQFVEIGRAVFMLAAVVPIMLMLDQKMTIVAAAFIPFILGFAFIFFLKVKKRFQASDEAEASMSTVLQENLSGVRVVRAFAHQAFEIKKFDDTNCEYRDRTYWLILLLAYYWMAAEFLGAVQFGAVLVFGAYWAFKGMISLGTVVVFIAYVHMLLWPIRQMGRVLTDMGKAMVALERIQEILDQTVETGEEHLVKPEIQGNLEFQNVSFEYEVGKPVLKNISFHAKQGQTIAILGPTGSGKTSLVHLLARLYDYQHGSIKVDGVELKEVDKKWLRKHVGLVHQEPFLFSKTIKENIGLAKQSVQEAEIVEAAQMASVHDVIADFENGYDTAVGERGVTLSGGQKQRVAIARTLLRECPILIFDDSLSAVDTETDAAIRRALRNRNHATTFMISHRVITLAEADVILVLDNGELVQIGSHAELIRQEGLYRKIWSIQNELEEELEQEMV